MTKKSVVVFWFRQDLRLQDNPALNVAINAAVELATAQQATFLPMYIYGELHMLGAASRVWLYHSLKALNTSLLNHVSVPLCLFKSDDALAIFQQLHECYTVHGVYWNRCYEPSRIEQDQNIKAYLKSENIVCQSFNGSLLWEPWEVAKADGKPYQVFTPFFRKGCLSAAPPRSPVVLSKIDKPFTPFETVKNSCDLSTLPLLPKLPWGNSMMLHWQVGEAAAHQAFQVFLDSCLRSYKERRNYPALPHTSRLSPHLHFGEISVNQLWYAAKAKSLALASDEDIDCFLSELAWREFSYHLLFQHPDLPSRNLQKKFDAFPWQNNADFLRAWQRGQTGVPMVDAGMRELWQTGFMHNRVRMVVASFLVKNLLVDWRLGAQWFLDCLVDADLANNSASWQWVAGCGMDAAPYFRVFNPVLQAEKFDADAAYIKRFVPELALLPAKYVFCPWLAPASVLQQAGVCLGEHYPRPIVDLGVSRDAALAAFKKL